jgi:hypothetical protein
MPLFPSYSFMVWRDREYYHHVCTCVKSIQSKSVNSAGSGPEISSPQNSKTTLKPISYIVIVI